VLDKMVQHHLTDKGLKQFLEDWERRARPEPAAARR
jgi:hypothetical protein